MEEPDALQSLKDILTKSVPSGKNGCLCRKPTARFKKLRERAKIHFGNQDYADAIDAYSTAIAECDRLWRFCILFSFRRLCVLKDLFAFCCGPFLIVLLLSKF